MSLFHPNIVGFIEVYDTRGGKKNIVMEHADGLDFEKEIELKKAIAKKYGKPPELFEES